MPVKKTIGLAAAGERDGRDAFEGSRCFDMVLNYACNARCLFCSQHPEWRKASCTLPFARAVEHIYASYQNGYRRLGFSGGEPTIRRDLVKLIALARRIGYSYIRIQTNGLRIADFAYARSLVDAGLNFVKFSIQGHRPELHDRLVRVPGAFDRCLRSIENLKKLKAGIGVNIVLNRWNYRQLPDFCRFFLRDLEISNFVIIAPLYEGAMRENSSRIGVRLTELAPYVRAAYEVFAEIGFPTPLLLLHFTPCVLPGYERQMLGWSAFNTTVVNPDGERKDLDAAVQNHTLKADSCRRCVYNARCLGVDRSYAELFGLAEISPLAKVPRSPEGLGAAQGRPRPVMTDNERCVLEVLKTAGPLDTKRFLAAAEAIPLCKDCRDENAVLVAAETLVRMGLVQRAFRDGKYRWSLKARPKAGAPPRGGFARLARGALSEI